ncbi:unnamed protein product, partial [Closterium sp. NIES-64]
HAVDALRSIFVYFRVLFYDCDNNPQGGVLCQHSTSCSPCSPCALFLYLLACKGVRVRPCGRTSRATRCLTCQRSTQRPTTRTCSARSSASARLAGAPWSPRLVESVFFGCIPVIVADNIVLPFSDVIPWREIAVFVPEKDVPKLDEILAGIGPRRVLAMQQRLASHAIRQAVVLGHPQPQEGDVFHQVLNGLARKLPHPPSTYLQAGDERLNWTAGPANDFKPWKPDSHV